MQNQPDAPKDLNDKRWSRLLRGSLLTSLMSKNISYVNILDARARTLITICALLIPLLITGCNFDSFLVPCGVAMLTCILSLITSIFVLMPKKVKPHAGLNYSPLHFTSYATVDEDTYLADMQEIISDQGKHTELFIRDIYHVGRDVLQPKNQWQRLSYLIFLIGNGIASLLAIYIAFIK